MKQSGAFVFVGKDEHMIKRTCTMLECNRAHVARGYCKAHYNQLVDTTRHAKKLVPCTWCGTEVMKGSGGGRKYGAVCSDQCRQYLATPYCILPADHWARWYGKSSEWTPPKPKVTRAAFISNCCKECGTIFAENNYGNPSTYCGRRCERRVARRIRKAREHQSVGTFRWIDVIRVWVVGNKTCAYCDEVMTEQPDPDHVTPISRGGRNDMSNI